MRRTIFTASVTAVATLTAAILIWKAAPAPAQPAASVPASPPVVAGGPQLPVAQVVLFSSGVGYFQREGTVQGNARVDLTFQVKDINDLLKSMVLQDLDGGQVSAVNYDSHDPIDRTLKSFAVNFTSNPSFGQVLNQARGEKVEVILQAGNVTQPGNLTGAIMGVEKQRQPAGKDGVVEVEQLNLWCAEGMRAVKLADLQRVRFLNPVMDSEIKRALEVLALSHDTQKKAVSLQFTGEGKRNVRVGYVVENPIWKTSYRLVLNKEGKPQLQGWAIVENPSDEDWSNVRMALISGRPISFQMDLYQPLYVPRPTVEPELFASLRPPTYSGAMEKGRALDRADRAKAAFEEEEEHERAANAAESRKAFSRRSGGAKKELVEANGKLSEIRLQRGVASAASAARLGDYFQYVIRHAVTLPRQKSALLPIVQDEVEAARVSIYNEGTHAKFPLLGLKFKNTTGLHLMQGPITVFDGANYAGDARILDLQPKEERLIGYAIDLGTEVESKLEPESGRLTAIRVQEGILYSTTKQREKRSWTVKNRSEEDRTVIIEHPYRQQFRLLSPEKANERAQDVYRFELKVAKGQTGKQEVVEERDIVQSVQLTNSDDQTIRYFFQQPVASDQVKEALQKALSLKGKLSATQRDLAQHNRTLSDITKDQERLRANLKEMPPTAAAYKRYLEKFDKQETEIEALQAKIKELQAAEHQQRTEYEKYLAGLNVE